MRVPAPRLLRIVLGVALCAATSASSPAARQLDAEPVPYTLLDGSSYREGCFPPCRCPLRDPLPMTGSFELSSLPTFAPLEPLAITHVRWNMPATSSLLEGTGAYVLSGTEQRLHLDLSIDGGPVQTFDSGFVEGGDGFPLIDVVVSLHRQRCFDVVLHVRALPTGEVPSVRIARGSS